jgi:DNA-binding NtrC family response regulator
VATTGLPIRRCQPAERNFEFSVPHAPANRFCNTPIRFAIGTINKDVSFAATRDEESGDDPSLAHVERTMLVRALERASWNQTRAAQLLKISRDTLRYKIKKFNLKPPPIA